MFFWNSLAFSFLFLKFFCLFLAALHGMWDFSSPTRDRTHTPYSGSTVLTTGPPGDSLSCFFDDPVNVGNLISGSSAFFKNQLKHLEVHGSRIVEAWLREF